MNDSRVTIFGCDIDAVRKPQAAERVWHWVQQGAGQCRYVVTPNVDHVVQLTTNEKLQMAYRQASMVLADGMPVVWASRLLRRPLPERVTGADLVPAIFSAVPEGKRLSVYLLGAGAGVAERAAERIVARWSHVEICGTYSPPFGFENDPRENERILRQIAAVRPDVLVVGLGAPKQELWVHANADRIQAHVALCVGATIDFLAAEKKRAPLWMQKIGLEWLHRLSTEPRRLLGRYAHDAWIFPRLVWRELVDSRSARRAAADPV